MTKKTPENGKKSLKLRGKRKQERQKDGSCLSSEILEEAVLADAVLEAELLPELHPDLVPALPHLDRYDLAWHLDERKVSKIRARVT